MSVPGLPPEIVSAHFQNISMSCTMPGSAVQMPMIAVQAEAFVMTVAALAASLANVSISVARFAAVVAGSVDGVVVMVFSS
jgi:hypothetical protein